MESSRKDAGAEEKPTPRDMVARLRRQVHQKHNEVLVAEQHVRTMDAAGQALMSRFQDAQRQLREEEILKREAVLDAREASQQLAASEERVLRLEELVSSMDEAHTAELTRLRTKMRSLEDAARTAATPPPSPRPDVPERIKHEPTHQAALRIALRGVEHEAFAYGCLYSEKQQELTHVRRLLVAGARDELAEDLGAALEAAQAQLAAAEAELRDVRPATTQLRVQLADCEHELAAARRELARKAAAAPAQVPEQSGDSADEAGEGQDALQRELAACRARIAELEADAERHKQELRAKDDALHEVTEHHEAARVRQRRFHAELQDEISSLQELLSERTHYMRLQEGDVDRLTLQVRDVTDALEDVHADNEALLQEVAALEKKVDALAWASEALKRTRFGREKRRSPSEGELGDSELSSRMTPYT